MVHALQSHVVSVEIEAQRELGVGGAQARVDRVVDGGLHRREIILRNVGAPLILNKERNSEYGVGCSLKPRLAERLVPKVVAGKKVGGWKKGYHWRCSVQTL